MAREVTGNNPRLRFDLNLSSGQAPRLRGRHQINNNPMMPQQQQMVLLQQQFFARQQIIQHEQLQKQRQLRQIEDKQAGLMVAIHDLQQKTLQKQVQQSPQLRQQGNKLQHQSLHPQQQPQPRLLHHSDVSFYRTHLHPRQNQPFPSSQPLAIPQSLNGNSAQHPNMLPARGQGHFSVSSSQASNSTSHSTTLEKLNNSCKVLPASPAITRLDPAPPFHLSMSNSVFPSRSASSQIGLISPGTRANKAAQSCMLVSTSNTSPHNSKHSTTLSTYQRPSLLGSPPIASSMRGMCIPCTGTQLSQSTANLESSWTEQHSFATKSSEKYDFKRPGADGNKIFNRSIQADQQSLKSVSDKTDRFEEKTPSTDKHRGKNGGPDRKSDREQGRSERRHSRWEGNKHFASKNLDRGHDRHRASSDKNKPERGRSRQNNRNHVTNSQSLEIKYSRHKKKHPEFAVYSPVATNKQQDTGPTISGNICREVNFSGTWKSGENLSRVKNSSPHKCRDLSNGKRERAIKRSRSPSLSSQQSCSAFGGQLSQYRQDLLKSDQSSTDHFQDCSRKRQKMNQDSDYININKEDSQEDAESDTVTYLTRSCPADLYFIRNSETGNMEATFRMVELETRFEEEIVKRADRIKSTQIMVEEAPIQPPISHHHHHHHCTGSKSSSSCDSSSSEEDDDDEGSCSQIMEEWDKRKKHPYSIHPELWFNLEGQANDGPLCRCSIKSRQSGIRHEMYPGEAPIAPCKDECSNLDSLYHYRITMSPYTNFLTKVPTLINHDNHEYIFEGFSMFSHVELQNIPPCKLLRFNIEYTIHFIPEPAPENFTVRSLNLFNRFIFTEILELIDMDWTGHGAGCNRFHFMPRFCRTLPDSGCKEVLSMNTVLSFLLKSVRPLVDKSELEEIMQCGESEWHAKVDHLRGMIVTNPGMRPSSLRIDQLDRKVTVPVVRMGNDDVDSSDEESQRQRNVDKNGRKDEKTKDDCGQLTYPLLIHQSHPFGVQVMSLWCFHV